MRELSPEKAAEQVSRRCKPNQIANAGKRSADLRTVRFRGKDSNAARDSPSKFRVEIAQVTRRVNVPRTRPNVLSFPAQPSFLFDSRQEGTLERSHRRRRKNRSSCKKQNLPFSADGMRRHSSGSRIEPVVFNKTRFLPPSLCCTLIEDVRQRTHQLQMQMRRPSGTSAERTLH